jgi:hypothetical protein
VNKWPKYLPAADDDAGIAFWMYIDCLHLSGQTATMEVDGCVEYDL